MGHDDVDEKQPHLPKGASIPRHQVAGHKHEGRSKLGLLEYDGCVLKALQKPDRGKRELDFYKKVFDKDCTDKDTLQLQQLMPNYLGSFQFDEYPGVTYIKLENLVSRFRKPCVVDIKIGKRTYDPEANADKIAREMSKFPNVEKHGFQFTGMQTYDPVEQRMAFYDKFFCRKLDDDELILYKGLGTYFSIKHGLRKDAIRVLLEKLREIEQWFTSQRSFSFYASSLLLIYEGDTSISVDKNNTGVNNDAVLADVRMIDFTHVFCVDEQDDNYLYGLKNLISNMQQLLEL